MRLFLAAILCSILSRTEGDKVYLDERHNVTIPVKTDSRLYEYATDSLPRHTFWISSSSPYIDAVFKPYDWIEVVDPENAAIVILDKRTQYPYLVGSSAKYNSTRVVPYLMNKVEGIHKCLTDKAKMHETLASIPDGQGLYAQTRTFVIASGKDCADFLALPETNLTTWVKKVPLEAEGRGIAFYPPNYESLPCNTTDWEVKHQYQKIILQAHIDHPFLMRNKKTEMRAYWAIASVDPLIVLLYNDGSVRLATSDYEDVSLDPTNALKHVLNTVQQKAFDPNYKKTADERKCSWLQLAEELKRLDRIQVEPQEWIDTSLKPAFARILKTCIEGSKDFIQASNREQNRRFEIFGMDVILEDEIASKGTKRLGLEEGGVPLDGGLRMWMTEAQLNPELSMDSTTKKVFIPPLLQEEIDIALEIDFKRREGKSLSQISSLKNFAVLVNEAGIKDVDTSGSSQEPDL